MPLFQHCFGAMTSRKIFSGILVVAAAACSRMLSESSAAGYASLRRFKPLRKNVAHARLFCNMFLYAVIHLEVF
jgi:hypothetical protein